MVEYFIQISSNSYLCFSILNKKSLRKIRNFKNSFYPNYSVFTPSILVSGIKTSTICFEFAAKFALTFTNFANFTNFSANGKAT